MRWPYMRTWRIRQIHRRSCHSEFCWKGSCHILFWETKWNKISRRSSLIPVSMIHHKRYLAYAEVWTLSFFPSLCNPVFKSLHFNKLCCFLFAFMNTLGTRHNVNELISEVSPELQVLEYTWYICVSKDEKIVKFDTTRLAYWYGKVVNINNKLLV